MSRESNTKSHKGKTQRDRASGGIGDFMFAEAVWKAAQENK